VRGFAKNITEQTAAHGIPSTFFETPEEAGEWLRQNLRAEDVVLLKASRGVRLERALDVLLHGPA
jgi:UDP-N-acetylmuramoyl-tripeptide--D-alanyl-D-alanine ligase